MLRAVNHAIRVGRDLTKFTWISNVIVENCLPALAVAFLSSASIEPAYRPLANPAVLVFFVFIILSTLRLDFWLSTFTGFVAAAELFGMAILCRPVVNPDPEPDIYYHAARSLIVLVCGVLAGAVGVQLHRQFAASILAATARDRITNLFGQHVSPQVVERLMAEGASATSDIRHAAVMFVDFRIGRAHV